jgi:hypothetical protein
LWSIDAYLEELRGKIGEAVKRAIPKSKVVWLNLTATRYQIPIEGAFSKVKRLLRMIGPGREKCWWRL